MAQVINNQIGVEKDFILVVDETFKKAFAIKDKAGNNVPLTGSTIKWIFQKKGFPDATITISTEDSISIGEGDDAHKALVNTTFNFTKGTWKNALKIKFSNGFTFYAMFGGLELVFPLFEMPVDTDDVTGTAGGYETINLVMNATFDAATQSFFILTDENGNTILDDQNQTIETNP